MYGLAKTADRRYRDIRTALIKLLGEPPTSTNEAPKPPSLFSNLPSGVTPKLTELRRRLCHRINAYLTGSSTLHRGWTILAVLLYLIFLIVLLEFRFAVPFLS